MTGKKYAMLEHYFGNAMLEARLTIEQTQDLQDTQKRFIKELESLTEIPDETKITTAQIHELILAARQAEWSNLDGLRAIYEKYCEITGDSITKYF